MAVNYRNESHISIMIKLSNWSKDVEGNAIKSSYIHHSIITLLCHVVFSL